jgi:predicted permease
MRVLGKARGFTAAAILTLSLGIALAASTMAIVNAYLVRSLPYPAADRLYRVTWSRPGEDQPTGLSDLPWESVSDVVEHPISWDLDMFYLTGGDHTEAAPGAWVTPGFMQGLGIRVASGRAFGPADFEHGSPQVALISDELWRTRFGGDSTVVGRRMEAYVSDRPRDPETFIIVGVLPAEFWHLNPYTQVLTPLRAPTYPYFIRLRENVPASFAESRITGLVRGASATLPADWRVALRPVREGYVAAVKPMLLAVGAAVGLVLLMACANVALLFLLRSMRRQKEIALRLALGAGKLQLARMLLLETVAIATAAAIAGTLIAWVALRSLGPTIEQHLGARVPGGAAALSIDLSVVGAVAALTIAIAVGLSLAPIVATVRRPLFTTLRQTRSGASGGSGGRRTRFALIGVEVAGSLALLVGCGLMVQTVVRMLDVDLGARYSGLTSTTLAVREQSYPDAPSRAALYDRVLQAVSASPGMSSVALSAPSPLTSSQPQPIHTSDAAATEQRASVRAISPGYLATLSIPILNGRAVAASDRGDAEPVALVSVSAARLLWQGTNPLGRRIRIAEQQLAGADSVASWRAVVGVVADVRQSPTDDDLADVYVPLSQAPGRFAAVVTRQPNPSAPPDVDLRRIVSGVDREIAVNAPQSLDAEVERQLARPRFLASLFGAFGLFASMLGIIGLYAVIAYAVKQREHEIAIRMAVGADARAIVSLFMREGVVVLLAGIAAGSLVAIALGRLIEAQLFGVGRVDPLTLAAGSIGLGLVSMVAIWWPARRATRTDPVIALREE